MPTKQDKAHPDQSTEAQSGPAQIINDAATLQSFGFNAMTGAGVAWIEALSAMGSEVLSFVADRIKEDVKTQHKMLHCRDIGELQQIQAEFVHTAIEQYREETGKLVEMSREFMTAPEPADKTGNKSG